MEKHIEDIERDFEPLLYKMLEKSGMWSPEKCKDFTSQISAGNTHVSDVLTEPCISTPTIALSEAGLLALIVAIKRGSSTSVCRYNNNNISH